MSTYSLGHIMDSIWKRLPKGDSLLRMNPYSMPNPHEFLLTAGRKIIEFCGEEGALLYAQLPKEKDRNAWYRLVAAWAFHFKGREMLSRAQVADELSIDPSNLTNFLNGKRPLTSNALLSIAKFMGIQPYDIRPELGAHSADKQNRDHCKLILSVERSLKDIEREIQALAREGVKVDSLLLKVNKTLTGIAR
ncbi:helix-turn-helix transcriptional regulator [Pseudomonas fluorescens]|uniref:helix-turn-helix domain-containing protein n=1 Tax=Pseudomonas TaxID=286 RepID=UPI000F0364E8|nr:MULTISPECIES: helix-turn-helix transcriptional regulator [Pseudomonas]MBD8088425.1 helix-turn-helix transcriptional regulator [Pseudomonas fluorescens]MBD8615129.1 helix-turn-helix transcriptional regulator [Pseudomonas putida]MBD8681196.1 helix-turn-helix transcriptional regulator [Pseudomonas sp. CFBP 13719]